MRGLEYDTRQEPFPVSFNLIFFSLLIYFFPNHMSYCSLTGIYGRVVIDDSWLVMNDSGRGCLVQEYLYLNTMGWKSVCFYAYTRYTGCGSLIRIKYRAFLTTECGLACHSVCGVSR